EWEAEYARRRKEIEAQLASAGISDPRQLRRFQQRAAELEERLADLPNRRERHTATVEARRDGLRKLGQVRRRKSRLVEEAAGSLDAAIGPRVRLTVHPFDDRTPLYGVLEAAVQGQGVRTDQLQRLAGESPAAI